MRLLENGAIALLPSEVDGFVRSWEADEDAVELCENCGDVEGTCDCELYTCDNCDGPNAEIEHADGFICQGCFEGFADAAEYIMEDR
jgi:hypothetical protein